MRRTAFISHSSADAEAAQQICDYLEQQGVPCWIAPRDVTPGHEFAAEIIAGLLECPVLVLILSENANSSVYVKREVERAVSAGKMLFPVRIREVEPSRSLELFVASSHWIDAWRPPIHQYLDRLVTSIKTSVAQLEGATTERQTGQQQQAEAAAPKRPSARRHKHAVVAAALIVLAIVAAGGGWWFLRVGSPPGVAGGNDPTTAPAVSAPQAPTGRSDADRAAAANERARSNAVKDVLARLKGTGGADRYRSITAARNDIPEHLTVAEMLAIIGESANRQPLLSSFVGRLPQPISIEETQAILKPTAGAERYRTIKTIENLMPQELTVQQALTIIGDSANRLNVLGSLRGRLPQTLSMEETLAVLRPTAGAERYRTIKTIQGLLPEQLTTDQALTIIGDSPSRLDLLSSMQGRLPQMLSTEETLAILRPTSGAERYRTIKLIASKVKPGLGIDEVLKIVGDSINRDEMIALLRR